MKIRVTSYTFSASAKTIVSASFTTLEGILLVTNVTTNVIIYNFADPAKGGALSGTTLTLDFNTTSMSDSDKLQIFIEDGSTAELVNPIVGQSGVQGGSGAVSANTQRAVLATDVSLPAVNFQDVFVTGQGSQTALNQNIVLATAGAGSYDTLNGVTGNSFRSASIQITPASGTITAGAITFEGSNDNFVSTANPIFLSDMANITAVPISTTGTLIAATPRYFHGAIPFRYFRVRISTAVTGTTTGLQAFSVFSTVPFSSPRLTVAQATAASLNATVSGTVTATIAAGATTIAKARDSAAAGTDTAIPALFIRRDTPTALTPVAGDYEPGQIDAMGALWVREKSSTTSAITSVSGSASSVTVLALNAQRRGASIHNDSAAILYLKLGATASTTSYTVKMVADSYYEVPANYTGIIDGIWASATGSARVTEVSA